MKRNNLFWISYSDIMTSLFFIMLVLFVVSYSFFRATVGEIAVLKEEEEEITAIRAALESLNPELFEFDDVNKRYSLNIDVSFDVRDDNIFVMLPQKLDSLELAGRELYNRVQDLVSNDEFTRLPYLLLIIEGNAQRACADSSNEESCNYITRPDFGYNLSYRRALALVNFWESRGISFDFGDRCEVIIAGSGYFGLSRDENNEELNRRFSLQITSKYTLERDNDNGQL